jgi:Flp pilus assembly protein TadD
MELDPSLAEAHFASALHKLFLTEDWRSAEKDIRRAVEISPRNPLFHGYPGCVLGTCRRVEDAEVAAAQARQLDPLAPFIHSLSALAMLMARRYEASVGHAERALELQSDFPLGCWTLGLSCCKLGQYERAIDALERVVSISKRTAWFVGALGLAYGLAGRRADAEALRNELVRRKADEYVVAHSFLNIDLGLGDRDQIYKDLEACLDDEVFGMSLEFGAGPFLDPLDADPQFNEIFGRLRLMQPRPVDRA